MRRKEISATLLAAIVVVSAVAGVAALTAVASPVAADQHTVDTATDYTEEANFTVNFLYDTDHYPGDQNPENGSIQYFAVGADAMRAVDAEEGAFLSHVVISADWIDYSACDVDNTFVFGFDRGNNNSGTQVDEDLVSRRKDDDFRDDGLVVEFYAHDDLGGDPPYGAPEDAIVAEQGARSSGGACLTLTDEPGWYQIQGFVNGTEADNGRDERPSADANHAGILARSNYLYVCECDSEDEAREELGPPPNEESAGDETPTPTDGGEEPTPTSTDGDAGDGADGDPTEETPPPETAGDGDAESTPATDDDEDPEETVESDDAGATSPADGDESGDGAADERTPSVDDGPGFDVLAALLALLASALLVHRRD